VNDCNHDTLVELRTDMKWIMRKLEELDEDVKDLKSFKWKVIGASGLAAFVISIIVNVGGRLS